MKSNQRTPTAPKSSGAKSFARSSLSPTNNTSPGLSKAVLGMKFMKRHEDLKKQEIIDHEKLARLQGSDWIKDCEEENKLHPTNHNPNEKIACVREYIDLYQALPGRRSFGGCNKAMEKHYQKAIDDRYYDNMLKRKKGKDDDDPFDIDDEEVIKRYDGLISLPRGPNQGMRPKSSLDQEAKHKRYLEQQSQSNKQKKRRKE